MLSNVIINKLRLRDLTVSSLKVMNGSSKNAQRCQRSASSRLYDDSVVITTWLQRVQSCAGIASLLSFLMRWHFLFHIFCILWLYEPSFSLRTSGLIHRNCKMAPRRSPGPLLTFSSVELQSVESSIVFNPQTIDNEKDNKRWYHYLPLCGELLSQEAMNSEPDYFCI